MLTLFDTLLAHLDANSPLQIGQVAVATGVPFRTIYKIKRRETLNPRIDTVQRLLSHFDGAPKPTKRRARKEAA